jgi:hypothetical protein
MALVGIGEERRQMSRTAPLLGIMHQGSRLRVGPFANDERHPQRAVSGDRRMIPPLSCLRALLPQQRFGCFSRSSPGHPTPKRVG